LPVDGYRFILVKTLAVKCVVRSRRYGPKWGLSVLWTARAAVSRLRAVTLSVRGVAGASPCHAPVAATSAHL